VLIPTPGAGKGNYAHRSGSVQSQAKSRPDFVPGLSTYIVAPRANMPDTLLMKPADLLRRLRRLATKRGWDFVETEGSNHTKVTLNGNRTAIGRHPKDLKNATFREILKQLGLKPSDLED
jgi:predicted RNA binding protein YcfA (HicA-like mRNA interferase family)